MVIGRKAIKTADSSYGTYGGRGLAQAGFWTGLVGTVYTGLILLIVLGVFVFGSSVSSSFEETCSTVGTDNPSSTDCR